MTEPTNIVVELGETCSGFDQVHFVDAYDDACSVECSTAIGDRDEDRNNPGSSFLWLGLDSTNPLVKASDARSVGVETTKTVGWVPYPIPDEVLLNTRMHLSRKHVAKLIGIMQHWLDHGNLEIEEKATT